MTNPKPCPFCGGTAEILGRHGGLAWVQCKRSRCGASGPIRLSFASAVKVWNREAVLRRKKDCKKDRK